MAKQTEKDFKNHLIQQIGFLLRSAEAYDDGYESEAKIMAGVLRILFHDTQKSVSLLTHLNKKNMLFYDTTFDFNSNDIMSKSTLAHLFMTAGHHISQVKYVPNLDDKNVSRNIKVPFNKWWEEKKVIRDMQGRFFTRKQLITTLCNKDGGAHIDAELENKKYADLTRNNSMKITYGKGEYGIGDPIPNIELASIRQITHEVLKSLEEEFPKFFKENNLIYSFHDMNDILDQTTFVAKDKTEYNAKIDFKNSKTKINIDTLIDYIKNSETIDYWVNVIKSLNIKIEPIGMIYLYRDMLRKSNINTLGELNYLLEKSKGWGEK